MAAGSETGSGPRTVDVSSLASSAGGARSEAFQPLSARTRRESLRGGLATAAAACTRCTGGVGSGSGSAGCDKSPGKGMPTEGCPLWVVCDRRCPIYFRARRHAQTGSVQTFTFTSTFTFAQAPSPTRTGTPSDAVTVARRPQPVPTLLPAPATLAMCSLPLASRRCHQTAFLCQSSVHSPSVASNTFIPHSATQAHPTPAACQWTLFTSIDITIHDPPQPPLVRRPVRHVPV